MAIRNAYGLSLSVVSPNHRRDYYRLRLVPSLGSEQDAEGGSIVIVDVRHGNELDLDRLLVTREYWRSSMEGPNIPELNGGIWVGIVGNSVWGHQRWNT